MFFSACFQVILSFSISIVAQTSLKSKIVAIFIFKFSGTIDKTSSECINISNMHRIIQNAGLRWKICARCLQIKISALPLRKSWLRPCTGCPRHQCTTVGYHRYTPETGLIMCMIPFMSSTGKHLYTANMEDNRYYGHLWNCRERIVSRSQ